MIKHLITGGCSFSSSSTDWIWRLKDHLQFKNPTLTYEHTGYPSQGQELIQKKVMLAVLDALDNNILPEDILVSVMWSGTYRKAWYIDNPDIISDIVNDMPHFIGGMSPQFLDLKNTICDSPKHFSTGGGGGQFEYNPEGGWYFTVNGSESKQEFIQQHYLLDRFPYGVGKVHTSLENIIVLQNFCKLHNIKLVQQFFMDFVLDDIVNNKDHQIINYLFKQLDFGTIIKDGMFEYLHTLVGVPRTSATDLTHKERLAVDAGRGYFSSDGFHPGELGSKIWCNEILIPYLQYKNYE